MTLEEPSESDYSENHNSITVSVDKELLATMDSFIVDFRKTPFSKGFTVRPVGSGNSSC